MNDEERVEEIRLWSQDKYVCMSGAQREAFQFLLSQYDKLKSENERLRKGMMALQAQGEGRREHWDSSAKEAHAKKLLLVRDIYAAHVDELDWIINWLEELQKHQNQR